MSKFPDLDVENGEGGGKNEKGRKVFSRKKKEPSLDDARNEVEKELEGLNDFLRKDDFTESSEMGPYPSHGDRVDNSSDFRGRSTKSPYTEKERIEIQEKGPESSDIVSYDSILEEMKTGESCSEKKTPPRKSKKLYRYRPGGGSATDDPGKSRDDKTRMKSHLRKGFDDPRISESDTKTESTGEKFNSFEAYGEPKRTQVDLSTEPVIVKNPKPVYEEPVPVIVRDPKRIKSPAHIERTPTRVRSKESGLIEYGPKEGELSPENRIDVVERMKVGESRKHEEEIRREINESPTKYIYPKKGSRKYKEWVDKEKMVDFIPAETRSTGETPPAKKEVVPERNEVSTDIDEIERKAEREIDRINNEREEIQKKYKEEMRRLELEKKRSKFDEDLAKKFHKSEELRLEISKMEKEVKNLEALEIILHREKRKKEWGKTIKEIDAMNLQLKILKKKLEDISSDPSIDVSVVHFPKKGEEFGLARRGKDYLDVDVQRRKLEKEFKMIEKLEKDAYEQGRKKAWKYYFDDMKRIKKLLSYIGRSKYTESQISNIRRKIETLKKEKGEFDNIRKYYIKNKYLTSWKNNYKEDYDRVVKEIQKTTELLPLPFVELQRLLKEDEDSRVRREEDRRKRREREKAEEEAKKRRDEEAKKKRDLMKKREIMRKNKLLEEKRIAELKRKKEEEEYIQKLTVVRKKGKLARLQAMKENNKRRLRYIGNVDILFVCSLDGARFLDVVKKLIPEISGTLLVRPEDPSKRVLEVKSIRYGFIGINKEKCVRYRFQDMNSLLKLLQYENCSGGVSRTCHQFKALERVGGMNWETHYPTRVLIQLTDTPCFGRSFYEEKLDDSYPDGDPKKRSFTELLLNIRRRMVHYRFFLVKKGGKLLTKTMASKFAAVYNKESKREIGVKFSAYDFNHNNCLSVVVKLVKEAMKEEYMATRGNKRFV